MVETQAVNLSAYTPTTFISFSDGHIYLSPRLVRKNQFPAVDLGKPVKRRHIRWSRRGAHRVAITRAAAFSGRLSVTQLVA